MKTAEAKRAKSDNSSQHSGQALKNGRDNLQQIHPNTCMAIRKQKVWLSKAELTALETDCKPMPSKVFDCLEQLLVHHLSETNNRNMFVANHAMMTDAINSRTVMSKRDLYSVIRCHHNFSHAQVIVFAFGEDKIANGSDGHWLLFGIDFSCDKIFAYDPFNRHLGVATAFEQVKLSFIAPHLCYLRQHTGPLDGPERGQANEAEEIIFRARAFELVTINTPTKQKDNYSCGFWAAKMMIQIVMEKRPLADVSVNVVAAEYRKVITRFMKTRYLYIDGLFKDPIASEEEKVPHGGKSEDDKKSNVSRIT